MAFLGLAVPAQTARILSEVDYGGVGTPEKGFHHITMLYLGDEVPVERFGQALPVIFDVTSKTRPFTVATNRVTTFPAKRGTVPVICRVTSDPLHELREKLTAAFNAAELHYDNKFPDFKPHVTLAYAQEGLDKEFPSVEWGAHELVLWGGDSGDGRLVVTFPFSLGQKAASMGRRTLNRAFVKVAASFRPPLPHTP